MSECYEKTHASKGAMISVIQKRHNLSELHTAKLRAAVYARIKTLT